MPEASDEACAAPPRYRLIAETRALADVARMFMVLRKRTPAPLARGRMPVIAIPGFNTGDAMLGPLRTYLERQGFAAEGWGMGRNMGGLDLDFELRDLPPAAGAGAYTERNQAALAVLCHRLGERVARRAEAAGEPVALVGWSMGGYIAREVARDRPEAVDRVVTLGAPVIGGPKYTASASYFRRQGLDLDWIESEVARREARPLRCRVTAIYSKSDAVVDWRATIDRVSPRVDHIEVNAAHLGLIFNPGVWGHIIAALAAESNGAEA